MILDEEGIRTEAKEYLDDEHQALDVFEEHGRWWVSCKTCGATWAVNEIEVKGVDRVEFERIDHGDGFCEEGS